MSERRLGYIVAASQFLANHPNFREFIGGTILGENDAEIAGDKRFLVEHPKFDLLSESAPIPEYTIWFVRAPNGEYVRGKIERCPT